MSVALDFGTYRLKCLRPRLEHLVGRSCRTALAVVPNTDASRRILENVQVTYAVCEDNLVVLGDSAVDVSRLVQIPSVTPLPDGRVPENDPPARQVILSLLDAVLPKPESPGELCCMTVPGGSEELRRLDGAIRKTTSEAGPDQPAEATIKDVPTAKTVAMFPTRSKNPDLEFLSNLVRLRGYQPLVLNAGMAAVLAHNADCSFSGVGIDFGASTCDASIAFLSEEIAHCNIRKGGNWIDETLAREFDEFAWDSRGNKYLDTDSVATWKESLGELAGSGRTPRERRLSELYDELLTEFAEKFTELVRRTPRAQELQQPTTLVACGGAARFAGFEDLLRNALQLADCPLQFGEVRIVTDSEYTVARGLMINGELENKLARTAKRAA